MFRRESGHKGDGSGVGAEKQENSGVECSVVKSSIGEHTVAGAGDVQVQVFPVQGFQF